jgi:transposase
MRRFVEGDDREQSSFLPASIEDYVDDENPVRVIEAFVQALELDELGFATIPAVTGRPSYHPATMLRIYVYGYVNAIQSSRRLERECRRNLELMWLTERLAPDFKTIADFRRDNGDAIRGACARFIVVCRQLGLFTRALAVIDGSKFKGVNSRDRNFTRGKVKARLTQVEEAISRYLQSLDAADRQESMGAASDTAGLRDKLALLEAQARKLKDMEQAVEASPNHQVSLTDPDARSMVTGQRLVGVVGYNVQATVDPEHHLIVAHEVTNQVVDRGQLPKMAAQAKDALGFEGIDVIADRGYYSGPDVLAREEIGVHALVPRIQTSNAKAQGRFSKDDFLYLPDDDAYRCPAGKSLTRRFDTMEGDMKIFVYWTNGCGNCPLKTQCTTSDLRRVRRWEHEGVIDAMTTRMKAMDAMRSAVRPWSTRLGPSKRGWAPPRSYAKVSKQSEQR